MQGFNLIETLLPIILSWYRSILIWSMMSSCRSPVPVLRLKWNCYIKVSGRPSGIRLIKKIWYLDNMGRFILTCQGIIFDKVFLVPLTTLKFVGVWSKHLQIFFGSLRYFSENVRKRSSRPQNIGKSSEIFAKKSKIVRKSSKTSSWVVAYRYEISLLVCSTWYLTRSLCSIVRYRVEHSTRNAISTRAHVLFSILTPVVLRLVQNLLQPVYIHVSNSTCWLIPCATLLCICYHVQLHHMAQG